MTSTRLASAAFVVLVFAVSAFCAPKNTDNSATSRLVGGELRSMNFAGNKIGTDPVRRFLVYLPARYDESQQRYPVIYFLPNPLDSS
jgi:hypothetical protein